MNSPNRLATGGRIDRGRPLRFTYDGKRFHGFAGDTLASALLAEGQIEVAPSIYLGRPRGIVTADCAEPNALVEVLGTCPEPMRPATDVELYDGLSVKSLSGVGWLGTAGDREADGREADDREADDREADDREADDREVHDKKYVHTDVLVIGAGPAGITAALSAGRAGARVTLVDSQRELGGCLLEGDEHINGQPALDWVRGAIRELVEMPEVRILTRSTATGYYDHNYALIAQRRPGAAKGQPVQRLWHVRAQQVVLATGAQERPLVFAENDRPGIMLASAVRGYVNRFAVLPGRDVVVFTTADSAYSVALDLLAAGARVRVVDARRNPPVWLGDEVKVMGGEVLSSSVVVSTEGEHRVSSVRVRGIDTNDRLTGVAWEMTCDLLAVCGGWNPIVHLYGQAGGALRWDDLIGGFVPAHTRPDLPRVIGAARGTYDLAGCVAQGFAAGADAATASGFRAAPPRIPPVTGDRPAMRPRPLWIVPGEFGEPAQWETHFVDLQRDRTVADVWRALGTGMRSVEHVKRYTTISTGSDQGKTSSVNTIGIIAQALAAGSPDEVGTTTFRPPYTPVRFALLAGRDRGVLHDPVRMTPMHAWHVSAGAVFENVGQWKRPWYYPHDGENMDAAVRRECAAARNGVAMMDASTLGKIEIVGPDAARFLNRVYTNGFAKLAVGKARYGMMCTADGMVFDDGVTMRLAEDRFLMSTTTGNAAAVLDWLEEWLQTEWPDLEVYCTSVTEQWAAVAVAGPDSRKVIAEVAPALDVSATSFPFMEFRNTYLLNGIPARISRISFSGELAYEINVATWYGQSVWDSVLAAGADYGITPYGTETMHVLRAEKGFVIVGQDTDGTVTPYDLGMDWVVSTRKDFIGKRSFSRPDTSRQDRKHLVGLLPVDPDEQLPEGAHLVAVDGPVQPPVPMLGHVTSSYYSEALGRTFALALVRGGRHRVGEVLHVPINGHSVPVTVTEPVFYDKEGARRDGR